MAETHEKLLDFERKQHQKMNFQDWTKSELIELIEAEGLEVPGEMLWDNEAGEMRKEVSMRARRRRSPKVKAEKGRDSGHHRARCVSFRLRVFCSCPPSEPRPAAPVMLHRATKRPPPLWSLRCHNW